MKIIIMGIQGSGKSTQGNILAEKLGIAYLSSGHILREMAREKTPLGRYIKETINAGVLVPDSKMQEIMEEYLKKPEYKKGFVLDGYPRTATQARDFSHTPDAVIYLAVSDKEALWRIAYRGDESREDETVIAIRKRIESFHEYTKPVLSHYRRKKLLIEIDGELSINRVTKEMVEKVRKISQTT